MFRQLIIKDKEPISIPNKKKNYFLSVTGEVHVAIYTSGTYHVHSIVRHESMKE